MKLRTSCQRASISIALAMAVATVFTLRSFAAPEVTKAVVDPALAQECTGALTVKAGQVTINGNAAQTGATVMTGSTIATSSNGKAIIDVGTLGRVEIGENTTATLTCVAGSLEIRTSCSRTEVEVRRGTVDVKSPKMETLTAGKKAKYDGGVDATSTTGVDVKVECEGRKAGAGLFVGPGLVGLLALIGIGAAVAIGVAVGGGDEAPASSGVR
jgi:ribosomal 50S subunit-recycling heat shock protein